MKKAAINNHMLIVKDIEPTQYAKIDTIQTKESYDNSDKKIEDIVKEINDNHNEIYKNMTSVEGELNALIGFYLTNVVPKYFKRFGTERHLLFESDIQYDLAAIENSSFKIFKENKENIPKIVKKDYYELSSLYQKHFQQKAYIFKSFSKTQNKNSDELYMKENLKNAIKGKSKYYSHSMKYDSEENTIRNLDFMELINEIKYMEISNEKATLEKKRDSSKVNINYQSEKFNHPSFKDSQIKKHYDTKFPNDYNNSFESKYFYKDKNDPIAFTQSKMNPDKATIERLSKKSVTKFDSFENNDNIIEFDEKSSIQDDISSNSSSDSNFKRKDSDNVLNIIKKICSSKKIEDENELNKYRNGDNINGQEVLHEIQEDESENSVNNSNDNINEKIVEKEKLIIPSHSHEDLEKSQAFQSCNSKNSQTDLEISEQHSKLLSHEFSQNNSKHNIKAESKVKEKEISDFILLKDEADDSTRKSILRNFNNEDGSKQQISQDQYKIKKKTFNIKIIDEENNSYKYDKGKNKERCLTEDNTTSIKRSQLPPINKNRYSENQQTNGKENSPNHDNPEKYKHIIHKQKSSDFNGNSELSSNSKQFKGLSHDISTNNMTANNLNNASNEYKSNISIERKHTNDTKNNPKYNRNNKNIIEDSNSHNNKSYHSRALTEHSKDEYHNLKHNKENKENKDKLSSLKSLNFYYLNLVKSGAKSEDFQPINHNQEILNFKNVSKKGFTRFNSKKDNNSNDPKSHSKKFDSNMNLVIDSIHNSQHSKENIIKLNESDRKPVNSPTRVKVLNKMSTKTSANMITNDKRNSPFRNDSVEFFLKNVPRESNNSVINQMINRMGNNHNSIKSTIGDSAKMSIQDSIPNLPHVNLKQIQKFQRYRSNVNYNILNSNSQNPNYHQKHTSVLIDTFKPNKSKDQLESNEDIAINEINNEEFNKVKLSEFQAFSNIENMQIEKHLEHENQQLSKEKDFQSAKVLKLYKEINKTRDKINLVKSEKAYILHELEKKEKELQEIVDDNMEATKTNSRKTGSKKNPKPTYSAKERLFLDINLRNQQFTKYKKEKLKEVEVIDELLEQFNKDLEKKHKRIKKAEKKQEVVENELFQIRNTLLLYYHRLLSMGTDVRGNGVQWIIISIWKLESNVVLNYLPMFFDKENCEYLFLKSHLNIILDKANYWLIKLKEQLRDYNKILLNHFFYGGSKQELIKKMKKINFKGQDHYLSNYYDKDKNKTKFATEDLLREDTTIGNKDINKKKISFNHKSIESQDPKKNNRVENGALNTSNIKKEIRVSTLDINNKADTNKRERLTVNYNNENNIDGDLIKLKKKHNNSNSLNFDDNREIKETKPILNLNKNKLHNKALMESIQRPSQQQLIYNTKNFDNIQSTLFETQLLNINEGKNTNNKHYISQIHQINEMMKRKKENSELANHIKLIKVVETLVFKLESILQRMKETEVRRISEENVNYHYEDQYLILMLKGIFGNNYWRKEYAKITSYEEIVKNSLIKCQLTLKKDETNREVIFS